MKFDIYLNEEGHMEPDMPPLIAPNDAADIVPNNLPNNVPNNLPNNVPNNLPNMIPVGPLADNEGPWVVLMPVAPAGGNGLNAVPAFVQNLPNIPPQNAANAPGPVIQNPNVPGNGQVPLAVPPAGQQPAANNVPNPPPVAIPIVIPPHLYLPPENGGPAPAG